SSSMTRGSPDRQVPLKAAPRLANLHDVGCASRAAASVRKRTSLTWPGEKAPAQPTAAAAPAGVRFRGHLEMPVGVFFQRWVRNRAAACDELFARLEHNCGSRFGLNHEALLGKRQQAPVLSAYPP